MFQVGNIPQGLPKFSIPKGLGHATSLIPTAMLITGVAILVTGRAYYFLRDAVTFFFFHKGNHDCFFHVLFYFRSLLELLKPQRQRMVMNWILIKRYAQQADYKFYLKGFLCLIINMLLYGVQHMRRISSSMDMFT